MLGVWHKTVLPRPYIRLLCLELLVKCGSYLTLFVTHCCLTERKQNMPWVYVIYC